VAAYPGADGRHVQASVDAGAAGVVLIALGAGNAGPAMVAAVAEAVAAGVHVLVTTRVTAGPVVPLYAGGGVALERAGAVFAGDLSPWQARVLLAVACTLPDQDPLGVVRQWLAG
jgi:L-asparaginase